MRVVTRREFMRTAAAIGATVVWASSSAASARRSWIDAPDMFAEGVASGDPAPDSVLLWTRKSVVDTTADETLTVEVAEDSAFERIVARSRTRARAAADHTCRVLVGGLRPATTYWYRFADWKGRGSRIGRTRTAALPDDNASVRFAFVSCQNVCEGAQNAYRRMIFEDERAAPEEQLAFVLHLGDFIYEVVEYPEDRPSRRRYDRTVADVVRFPQGEKIAGFHIPVTVDDYRELYRAYLRDPDLQAARARWPFVAMWDNHEFSWLGWQSIQVFKGESRPAQTRKIAANQAWFEYQPARVSRPGTSTLERFDAPKVEDRLIENFDDQGLGQETNNLVAISSLTGYRQLRWGKHLDLIITDQHSYRSREPSSRREAQAFSSPDFPDMISQDVLEILDAGRAYAAGRPPDTINHGAVTIPNFRRTEFPQTILGQTQQQWFLERLRTSGATWKVWGNSVGTLDARADLQNLPKDAGKVWPGQGFACLGGLADYATAFAERAEIYDAIRESGITGFVTVSGDRHSFWAGLAAKSLPPAPFEPVGAAFITGSISAVGLAEAYEHAFPKDHPLRALYVADVKGEQLPAVNLLLHHGVHSCLEYQRTQSAERARQLSNPQLAPHLSFIDMAGHGYAVLTVTADAAECQFVCIPRPLSRNPAPDGGPIRYRVTHRLQLWARGEAPKLQQHIEEGNPELSI